MVGVVIVIVRVVVFVIVIVLVIISSCFDSDCRYDVILGADFLDKIGMNLLYKTLQIEWLGNVMPMESIKPNQIAAHVEAYLAQMEVDDMGVDLDSYLSAPILDAKYERLDIDHVVRVHCRHLTTPQQADLRTLLARHTKLFDGTCC